MKNKTMLLVMLITLLFSTNYALSSEQVEFDGGYIKTQNGNFIELREIQTYRMTIIEIKEGFQGYFGSNDAYNYIMENERQQKTSIAQNEFKGIAIKGQYKFDLFSLHPLVKQRLKHNNNIISQDIKNNTGPATQRSSFYIPGNKIDIRSKSLSEDTYYWQPRQNLSRGEYVAWIGNSFWLFEIK